MKKSELELGILWAMVKRLTDCANAGQIVIR